MLSDRLPRPEPPTPCGGRGCRPPRPRCGRGCCGRAAWGSPTLSWWAAGGRATRLMGRAAGRASLNPGVGSDIIRERDPQFSVEAAVHGLPNFCFVDPRPKEASSVETFMNCPRLSQPGTGRLHSASMCLAPDSHFRPAGGRKCGALHVLPRREAGLEHPNGRHGAAAQEGADSAGSRPGVCRAVICNICTHINMYIYIYLQIKIFLYKYMCVCVCLCHMPMRAALHVSFHASHWHHGVWKKPTTSSVQMTEGTRCVVAGSWSPFQPKKAGQRHPCHRGCARHHRDACQPRAQAWFFAYRLTPPRKQFLIIFHFFLLF